MDEEGEWAGEFDPFSDPEERRVLFAALDSFWYLHPQPPHPHHQRPPTDNPSQYRKAAHYNITHLRRQNYYALPTAHTRILSAPPFSLLDTFERVDAAIDANADIAERILSTGLAVFNLPRSPSPSTTDPSRNWQGAATPADLSKARTTIRQLYRDWSAAGAAERDACYRPVLQDLAVEFDTRSRGSEANPGSETPDSNADPNCRSFKVLVPGAGLGRLVFEICRAGYSAEGNEISYHALLAGSWVLNHTRRADEYEVFPFALGFSNHVSREAQLSCVRVPDVCPAVAMREGDGRSTGEMSMTAADFVVLYGDEGHKGAYDAVATVFFVDTAPNLLRYVETIWRCLRDGGVWINLGPLLWHFEESGPIGKAAEGEKRTLEGIGEPGSVELTNEEVLLLVERMGFRIEKHEIRPATTGYIQDPESMLQNLYRVSHWTARKIS